MNIHSFSGISCRITAIKKVCDPDSCFFLKFPACKLKQMNSQLRVENPCPMLLSRMSTGDGCFECKSCKKEVIDFRNKSSEEIKDLSTPETCGIFTIDQLPGQQKMGFSRKAVFYALAFCSFLGFNITPVQASTKSFNQTGIPVFSATVAKEKETEKPKKKKKSKKAKKAYTTIGCPSF